MIQSLHPAIGRLDAGGLDDAYRWPGGQWLRANFALTADGAAEVGGRSGGIGGTDDRAVFLHLRGGADAVLVGSGTVRTENYGAVRVDDAARSGRAKRGQAPGVPLAVVTTRADLDPGHRMFRESAVGGPRPLVLTCEAAPDASTGPLREVAEVVVCGGRTVDATRIVAALGERGLQSVLCEGGPTVLALLLRAGVLDELCLTTAPLLAGPGHTGLLGGDPFGGAVAMTRTHLLASDDGTLFARYRIHPPPDEEHQ